VVRVNTTEQYKQNKHPLDVIDDVYDYADELSFEEIEERAGGGEWERLKWAGMYAQKQEGYFMIRTKVPGGKLTPEQAEVIGEVTEDLAVAPEEYGGEEQNELWETPISTSRPVRTSRNTGSASRTSPRCGTATTRSA